MEEKEIIHVQNQIGYDFKNSDLLQQAFTRRSFSEENGGADNEVQEFIGDKVLDIAVVKYLSKEYGYMAEECDDYDSENDYNEYFCEKNEGELTSIKQRLVEKKNLAQRIDALDLARCLIMGKGDEINNVGKEMSVKEDLFEAILGAVAIDSNWDFNTATDIAISMLAPDSILGAPNYVRLIEEWEKKRYNSVPWYRIEERSYTASWYQNFDGISEHLDLDPIRHENPYDYKYWCLLKISPNDDMKIFRGFGRSKSEARQAVCKLAYEYLEKNDLLLSIRDEIENPNKEDAINQLEILARRGYFSVPVYDFSNEYDENGNPIWKAECHIKEYDEYYWAQSSSKKDAKKEAAYSMLLYVLDEEE